MPMADRRVLVLEDDRDIAHLVELHLRDLQCVADVCSDGTQGLDLALRNRYDLVVLDLMLPGTDGLEICRRLRAQSTSRGSPVGKPAGQRYGNLHRPFGAGRFDDDRS